ncbi:MAG: chromate transporter [Lachnospiraceae bacterium]|jgi:chromate transporter|nr:chromate transporter [Lachnospiraceae bacterium]MCH4029782.1 chromate transporter [Lachnospiraceae bacterium]MCH4067366.1 chromate transporter [Lachnospiraceae bacterium]MCH4113390.1 chromate transporter [Lachnospiraceae bacterium]MCI1352950.1 chromate transporter [Lachnospiraceae bacterium]
MSVYIELFLAFLQIGAFSFGGGYAAMPLIQEQVVGKYGWLSLSDFTDLVTISQMTPGPIAVNAATFVGENIAGIPGAIVATFGCILPSCIFVTILAHFYLKYRKMAMLQGILGSLRPAVVAMIFSAGLLILIPALFESGAVSFIAENFNVRMAIWFAIALFLLMKMKWDPILVMVLTGVMELAAQTIIRFC